MRSRGPLACSGLLVAFFLSACTGGLYTAEGLPPLDAGGGNTCGATQLACNLGGPQPVCTEVVTNAQHCGDCVTVCTSAPAGGTPACENRVCTFTCAPGFLRAGATCATPTALAAGAAHTCGIAAGRLKCWGANSSGQVPGGSAADVLDPLDAGLDSVTAVGAGTSHTCAVAGGTVHCYGLYNGAAVPATVPAAAGATQLAGGLAHSCAVVAGGVTCWGSGPAATAPALSGVTAIASGANHACAVHGGGVTCWGATDRSQTGSTTPTIAQGSAIDLIAAGNDFTCAASSVGADLVCWGDNSTGQLPALANPQAIPAAPQRSGGRPITQGKKVLALAAGGSHTCLVVPIDGVGCFGADTFGQLGGPFAGELVKNLGGPDTVSVLALGGDHGCMVFPADGLLRCWGRNDSGQLGSGAADAVSHASPLLVSGK